MKKKLKLSDLKLKSFVTVVEVPEVQGGHSTKLTCMGGFTCEDIAGCGGIYSVWDENGNLCGDSLACPRHDP
ncbi:MAG: pinensin family lanthipeptide [Acidobacteriota bacterium]|nr:pinensin family lanthipeptide [Acidobacteriota bacterium]